MINDIKALIRQFRSVARGNHPGWYHMRRLTLIDPLMRLFEYLIGVSIPRQRINRIKPNVISQLSGDIIEIGGFDNYFRSRYKKGCYKNLDITPGKYVDIVANAENIPEIKSGTLGGVVCISVIEHTQSPEKIIREAYRCLDKDGILLLSSPWLFESHMEPNDFLRFSKYQLQNWCSEFTIIDTDYSNSYWGAIAHFLQRNVPLRYTLGLIFFLADLLSKSNSKWATQITLTLKKTS